MNLNEILLLPTSIDKVHESVYRSYHILDHILVMVERGDSAETIAEVAELLKSRPIEVKSSVLNE